ncbi:MAG: HINT domain-containing protein, partial [Coriobacteriales bacterium]|nr:HINT domain-containing protein [Coriobacteriales bacterium]
FTGALTGALFGGLGGAGQLFGQAFGGSCRIFTAMGIAAKASGGLSLGMGAFDLAAWGAGILAPSNAFTAFNQQLHESDGYNMFQFSISALAVFSGSAYNTMRPIPRTCFVAGTMVHTATGLVAIESIKAGDRVTATNPDTFEVAEMAVVEAYVREVTTLVQLSVGGELVSTTADHPFFVEGRGFVAAGELQAGDVLVSASGGALPAESARHESLDEPVTVYNFQVEDFHTYHVGTLGILVHNAKYPTNPVDLLQQGYEETTPAGMRANTSSREFFNPETGDRVRFDPAKPGARGFEGVDHYHQRNPNATGRGDLYLDRDGNPVPKGSRRSHIIPTGDD